MAEVAVVGTHQPILLMAELVVVAKVVMLVLQTPEMLEHQTQVVGVVVVPVLEMVRVIKQKVATAVAAL